MAGLYPSPGECDWGKNQSSAWRVGAAEHVYVVELGSDRLKGRDNLLTKSKREKTEQPGMNIGNYQQWGPVGAAKEAFDLLTGLVKSE